MSFGGKYKTYDTSEGFGSKSEWEKAWGEIGSGMFDRLLKGAFGGSFEFSEDEIKDKNEKAKEKYSNKSKNFFSNCKTRIELKSEYRNLMKVYHPDIAGESSNEICKLIIKEYEIKWKKLKK